MIPQKYTKIIIFSNKLFLYSFLLSVSLEIGLDVLFSDVLLSGISTVSVIVVFSRASLCVVSFIPGLVFVG